MSKSKSKSSSKAAKPAAADALTKVKDAAVVKPAQTVKSKSKDLAKQVATKEDKKDKKSKKKAKEPTPEPSESEESESSDSSSESEGEEKKAKSVAGKGKTNGVKKPAPAAKPDNESGSEDDSDSDESMANAEVAAKAASSDEDSDDSSDDSSDEKPVTKAVNKIAETAQAVKESVKDTIKKAVESDSDSEADSDADSSDDSDKEDEATAKSTKRKAEDAAAPTTKKTKTEAVDTSKGGNLFVGNLSWNVDEAWLKEVFEEFGELSGVRIVTDRDSGRSKGFGYVEFVNPEDAAKAHAAKANAELDGRNLNVDFANARPDNSQKQENRRKSYGDSTSEPSDTLFIGNLSFEVGQEAVTEAFAPHGTILGIRLPTDRDTGAPKGFGYVTFTSADEAAVALEAMQGAYIEGRPLRLDYSSPRPQNSDSPARGRGGFGGRGGGRGGARGGRGGRGGNFGGRGGSFGGRGGRGGSRGGSTNRGGFGDFSGNKTSFD